MPCPAFTCQCHHPPPPSHPALFCFFYRSSHRKRYWYLGSQLPSTLASFSLSSRTGPHVGASISVIVPPCQGRKTQPSSVLHYQLLCMYGISCVHQDSLLHTYLGPWYVEIKSLIDGPRQRSHHDPSRLLSSLARPFCPSRGGRRGRRGLHRIVCLALIPTSSYHSPSRDLSWEMPSPSDRAACVPVRACVWLLLFWRRSPDPRCRDGLTHVDVRYGLVRPVPSDYYPRECTGPAFAAWPFPLVQYCPGLLPTWTA